jgi:hypothetical protein
VDGHQGEYREAAERERLGSPDPPGRAAAFAVSVAALVVFCVVLLVAGLRR